MMTRIRARLLASALLAGGAAFATPALAQVAPQEAVNDGNADIVDQTDAAQTAAEDVVVTGSRIARPDLELSSPVTVVGAEEIALRAPASVEQVLRQLPGVAPGINPAVNNGANGVASFNFRNLGTNRNLVLLNSRRVVPSTIAGVVDLNVIPVALIERSDLLTGGAVTNYGADAIAGVINFITRRDFSGFEANALYGVTERGDGQSFRLDLTTGANFDDGRGNVVLGVSYTDTRPVLQGNRDIGTVSRASTFAGTTSPARGTPQGSNTAVPASVFFPIQNSRFDPASGTIVAGLSDYNFNPLNYFQTPLDRWSVYGSGHYEITSGVEAFTEALFTRSTVVQNLAPTGTFTEQFQVPLNNQFLTPAQRTQLCAAANVPNAAGVFPLGAACPAAIAAGTEITGIFARRFVESGPRVGTFRTNLFQVTAGFRGSITESLNWEVFGQYGEAERRSVNTNTALRSRVQQALRGCPTGSTAGCVPINIFGAEGTLSQASLAFVGVPTTQTTNTEFADAQAIISGDLGFSSPLADSPIGIAVGAEYRRNAASQLGDLPNQIPGEILGAGGAFLTIDGEIESTEFFGELNAPLITDRPFFHDLTLEAGVRYSDFSTTGGNTTYKVGGSWSPIEAVKFRGLYTRAVRSPNVSELFSPVNTVLNNLAVDPCQGTVAQVQARGANNVALCTEQLNRVGLPASALGSIPAPIAGQINVTSDGNENLDPERATTITAGVVLQPRSIIPGLSITADWYRIRVRGAITTPTVGDILNGCFSQASPADTRCQLIFRNPLTGGLSGSAATTQGVFLLTSNQGFLETEGVDFNLSYTRDFGAVRFSGFVNGNYTDKSRFQSNPNSFIRECTGFYSVSCDPPQPEFSLNARATLGFEGVDVSLLWRHISELEYEPRTGANATTQPAAGTVGSFGSSNPASVVESYRQIDEFNYFDLNIGFDLTDALRLNFLVENLLDKDPPEVGNTIGSTSFNSGNTYPSVYDALGRRFTASARLRF
ncbi:TonB-dependent receptor domain-containing protein [Sphingomonas lenta]|uniref:TonB-dependent receptor n=1 Tax=Sphingomonas lenta TaxID=1141887 RepID=A0A2A2SDH7_9SPHN|nr:TonB-dependent receptor [Sphingomonas lenta]PAX07265.1 TonB-dependent receptor [Sphingomonas lenta]